MANMKDNNHRDYPEKANKNLLIVGGVVIAVAGVGAYYLYTQNELLNELEWWILDYQREYDEFMEDGIIDENEREQLEVKRLYIDTLIHEIEEKGLIDKAIDMLWSIGIVVTVLTAVRIIWKIMERYFKRNPPPQSPPGKPYQDPWDDTWHAAPDDLADHIEDEHPVQDAPEPLKDVWTQIQLLPEWIIEILKDATTNFTETWERGWDNTPEWTHVILVAAIAVTIALLLVISLGTLAPTLQPVITAIAMAMA